MCLEQHVLTVIHHLGFTKARGKQSTGLDSLLTRVTQLLKLMLLKGTYFSNLSDHFYRKIGLGFLKSSFCFNFPLPSSLLLLPIYVPTGGITDGNLWSFIYMTAWPKKSNLRRIYYSYPLSVESRCKGSIHNHRGTFNLENYCFSPSVIDNPYVLDLITETTRIHLGHSSNIKAEIVCMCVHMHICGHTYMCVYIFFFWKFLGQALDLYILLRIWIVVTSP